jgi:hypothetical protein
MAYLIAVWICFVAFAAAGLFRLVVLARIRKELGLVTGAASGEQINGETNSPDLLNEHHSRFPASSAGSVSRVLFGVQLLATVAGTALGVAAQFQPHSLFHLISAAR